MSEQALAVLGSDPMFYNQASLLAGQLDVVLLTDMTAADQFDYLLQPGTAGLQLYPVDKKRGGPLMVDFASSASLHRLGSTGIRQDIARAVGCKPGFRPQILDATAGLGSDAFVLASLGCQLLLLEHSALVYALLSDGLARAAQQASAVGVTARENIRLLPRQNALDYLAGCAEPVDVVYLDPMFPERQKSAKVKKSMQYLHDLLGIAHDQEAGLLQLARLAAGRRVVVKRALHAPLLAAAKPSLQIKGKSVRYDVYLNSAA